MKPFRSILIALLLAAHACAGTPYSTLLGEPPAPRSAEFVAWADSYISYRLKPLAIGKKRATTYFVDAVNGDDDNLGLTPDIALQTPEKVHDLIQAGNGNQRFRFKLGQTWRGYGKDHQWTVFDDGHWAAILVNKTNITLDDYGNPLAGNCKFIVGTLQIAAATSYTQAAGPNTNAWYVSTAGFGAEVPNWVVEDGDEFNKYDRELSLAACHANARSFYYDSAASRLYIHDDDSNNPNDNAYTVIPRNDNDFVRTTHDDNIIAIHATYIGWGMNDLNSNRHDYGVSAGQTGTNSVIIAHGTGVYGSCHTFATWNQSGSGGGIFTVFNCHWSLCTPLPGNPGFNAYQPNGDAEYLFVGCSVFGTALDGSFMTTIDGHTTDSALYQHDLVMIYDCDGVCICGGLPTPADLSGASTDIQGFKLACHHGTQLAPSKYYTPSTKMVEINCQDWLRTVDASTGHNTSTPLTSLYLNHTLGLNNMDRTGSAAYALTSSTEASNTARFENHHFYFKNTAPNTRSVGIVFPVMNNANGTTPSNIVLKNGIIQGDSLDLVTNPLVVGVGNTSTNQVRNAYWQILSAGVPARPQGGYSSSTSPLELSQAPDVTGAVVNPQLIVSEASEALYYDRNWRARTVGDGQITAGPFEDETIRGALLWAPRNKVLLGTP